MNKTNSVNLKLQQRLKTPSKSLLISTFLLLILSMLLSITFIDVHVTLWKSTFHVKIALVRSQSLITNASF